jgi:CheY-like chemotaxis protein
MPATQKGNVLLVEDNRLGREMAASFLEENGFTFSAAVNGQEALDVFAGAEFDLVLLDIEMPVLNGYEVAKKIRAAGSAVPIIAMTGHDSENEKQKCLAAGMNDCISKPFDTQKLLSLILAYLNLTSATASTGEVSVPAGSPESVIDLSHLRSISKGRNAFFMSMIEIFLEQNNEDMSGLETAIKKNDFENIHLLAHKIATSIIFMGLEKHIHSKLKEIEQLAETRSNPERIKKLFREVAVVSAKADAELRMVKDIGAV